MKQIHRELPFTEHTHSTKGFVIDITENGVTTYVSVNADMAPLDGELTPTGSYHIYYLHPIYGSTTFLLNVFGNEPQSEDMPSYMEPDIVAVLVKEIHRQIK